MSNLKTIKQKFIDKEVYITIKGCEEDLISELIAILYPLVPLTECTLNYDCIIICIKGGKVYQGIGGDNDLTIKSISAYEFILKVREKEKQTISVKSNNINFSKDNLKTGMWVENTKGELAIVLLDTPNGNIVSGEFWFSLDAYSSDKLFDKNTKSAQKIQKVYLPKSNCTFGNKSTIKSQAVIIWDRQELEKNSKMIESKKKELELHKERVRIIEDELKVLENKFVVKLD